MATRTVGVMIVCAACVECDHTNSRIRHERSGRAARINWLECVGGVYSEMGSVFVGGGMVSFHIEDGVSLSDCSTSILALL